MVKTCDDNTGWDSESFGVVVIYAAVMAEGALLFVLWNQKPTKWLVRIVLAQHKQGKQ